MTHALRIQAVVANWNGGEENVDCVASLLAQGLAPKDVIFVDNGSTDGSLELVMRRFPGLTVLRNDANLGFGEASNQGARLALDRGAEAVYFANNDTTLEPGVLERLARELAEHDELGIVGPRVLYKEPKELVWCAGGMLTWRQNLSTLLGHREPDAPKWRERRDVDYVAGCSLLARSTTLLEVGLFDARFFAYMEDVDLCLRAKRAGWDVVILGEVCAWHTSASATGGGYNPRRKYMMGVNSVWFLRQHARLAQWLSFLVFDFVSLPLVWIAAVFQGQGRSVVAKAKGILDGLRGRRVTAASIADGASWLWRRA
ncbi:MAG: glycosyltransferase family 2 protein [Planctomycetes bacterium]|nr:glycosyltransferase family 2 protein [Planctomycetota bacterium]